MVAKSARPVAPSAPPRLRRGGALGATGRALTFPRTALSGLLLIALLAAGCLPFRATPAPKSITPAPLVRVAETATPGVPAPAPDATPEAVAPAPAAEDPATRLETVRQAYGLLLDKFVHSIGPRTLLEAGW